MDEFNNQTGAEQHEHGDAGVSADASNVDTSNEGSRGSSVQESDFDDAIDQALGADDHNHAPDTSGNRTNHTSLDNVSVTTTLNASNVGADQSLKDNIGKKGDFLDPKGGNNTVIGTGDSDVFVGTGGGLNTFTTGGGRDTIILGSETTNRIFDFNPQQDQFGLSSNLDPNNIVVAQGKNPGKGGIDQPLDSENNALVIDKSTEHILASLTFAKASDINAGHFKTIDDAALDTVNEVKFGNVQEGNGQLTGTKKSDKLVGGGGDDFLYVGDDGFKINKATGDGPGEFPFPNDSPGTTRLDANLKGGVLEVNGTYKNFDGAPLFSQGERELDETAVILNGSDPNALIEGFLRVPNDSEGNPISGTHLHFSPSGDSRGNFADATVERYFTNTPKDAKSGTISGTFELSPEEQASFLAGNFYANLHTNVDVDGDGKGGFPTGENRVNFNQNVVQLT